jgi:2-polyprenyl-6-methoxyphenol hydroxylase-like FAD-dependent oxidoreductase
MPCSLIRASESPHACVFLKRIQTIPNPLSRRRGACQALEDASALSLIFSPHYQYTRNIPEGLAKYQELRKPRADRVAYCSALATEDIRERIGFSSLVSAPGLFSPHLQVRSH